MDDGVALFRTSQWASTSGYTATQKEAEMFSNYRGQTLYYGLMSSGAAGIAGYVMFNPHWVMHKPRQYTKMVRLAGKLGGLSGVAVGAVWLALSYQTGRDIERLPPTPLTQRYSIERHGESESRAGAVMPMAMSATAGTIVGVGGLSAHDGQQDPSRQQWGARPSAAAAPGARGNLESNEETEWA